MISSLKYHTETSYERHTLGGHTLDWVNQPRLFKNYPDSLDRVPLPQFEDIPQASLWALPQESSPKPLDLDIIARLLDLTQTVTAKARHANGDFFYRSAASAGALYPNEIYVAAHDVTMLDPGLYHYDIYQRSLTAIRKQPVLTPLIDALPQKNNTGIAATFFITGIFNRSAWKYRQRAYRYVLLDAGHILWNLMTAVKTLAVSSRMVADFSDTKINHLLGVDGQREVCLVCVNLFYGSTITETGNSVVLPDTGSRIVNASQTADSEMGYPLIRDIHQSGCLTDISVSPLSKQPQPSLIIGPKFDESRPFRQQSIAQRTLYPNALFTRRSKRNFVPATLPHTRFMELMDFLSRQGSQILRYSSGYPRPMPITVGFIADHIEGLESGFYLCDFDAHCFGKVTSGKFQSRMAAICLDQVWLKNACLHVLFMTNFQDVDHYWGARGYRYAMLEAGRLGQALYVAATALNLGCCGIGALFDYDAQDVLTLNATSFLCYLVAVGIVKK